MPYIDALARHQLDGERGPQTPGELTYEIMLLVKCYLNYRGKSYTTIAEVLGSLEGFKADFIRRVVSPYEERKQRENGDAWQYAYVGSECHGTE